MEVPPQGTPDTKCQQPWGCPKALPTPPCAPPPHDTYTAEWPTEGSLGCPGLQEALLSLLTPPGSDAKHRYTCSHTRTRKEQPPSRAHHTPGSPLLSRLRPYLPAFSPLPGTFCTFCSLGLTNCCSSSGPSSNITSFRKPSLLSRGSKSCFLCLHATRYFSHVFYVPPWMSVCLTTPHAS